MIGNAVPVRLASYMAKAISVCLVLASESGVAEPVVEYYDSHYLSGDTWI